MDDLRDECIRLSRIISRIDYALGPPNEMECSLYDVDVDDDRVVRMVAARTSRINDLTEEIHRTHPNGATQFYVLSAEAVHKFLEA